MKEILEDQIKTFNEKKNSHTQNWKKIRALVNFSKTVENFNEWNALEFIISYFAKGFLDPEQEAFLDYILRKYKLDYTKWCYKTLWVKNQIAARKPKQVDQLHFWFQGYEEKKYEDRLKFPLYSKLERHKQIKLEPIWT